MKKLNLLSTFQLNIISNAVASLQNILPYHAYLIWKELEISTELHVDKNSNIGTRLLLLCKPLQRHINCDLFSKHSDVSQVEIEELIAIFNSRCNQLCLAKCFDELCRRNKFVQCPISGLNDDFEKQFNQIFFADLLFKSKSILLICSFIRYINKFSAHFSIETVISIFNFYCQPEIASEIRMEICNNLGFLKENIDLKKYNFLSK